MAEPRRPRVIRSRPETVRPDASGQGTAAPREEAIPAGYAPADVRRNTGPGPGAGKAGLPTSSKVSMLPQDDEPAPRAETPATAETPRPATSRLPGNSKLPRLPGNFKLPRLGENFRLPRLPQRGPAAAAGPGPAVPGQGSPQPQAGPQGSGPSEGATVLAFPEPAHKRRRRHVVIGTAGVAAVVAVIMVLAMFSPLLAVRTITFDGRKLVPEQTLQTALAGLQGRPLPQVSQEDVDGLLANVPQVKSARIVAQPPSTLVVHLVERVPVALLNNGKEYLLVDQDGIKLGSTKDPASVALPLIAGGTKVIGNDTFKAMTAVLATLPQSILGKLANASAKTPDTVELKLADGKTVVWGNADDMELKAAVLEALLLAPPPTADPGKPEPAPVQVYDVSAPRHPVTR